MSTGGPPGEGARSAGPGRAGSVTGRSRGVSEVVGVVLLVGLVLLGAVAVVLVGGSAVEENERQATLAQAEHSMVEFGDRADRASPGEGPERVDVGLSGRNGEFSRSDDGWLRVNLTTNGGTAVLSNRSLGAVVYEDGDAAVGYQGGGVFRAEGGHAVVLSAPGVEYTDETLSVTYSSLDGDRGLDGAVGVAAMDRSRAFPARQARAGPTVGGDAVAPGNVTNPLSTAQVSVTVKSRFYRAWGSYFEERLPGRVVYDHGNRTVTVHLRSLQPPIGTAGIIATARSGDLSLAGTGAYTDSYNSAAGTYAATSGSAGTVRAAGDVHVTGNAEVRGDVRSGETVTLDGSARVDGNARWTDQFDGSGSHTVTGNVRRIDGVETVPPVGAVVNKTVDRLSRGNDNDETAAIQNDELSIAGGSAELDAGSYYLETLDLQGKELVLNTTGGDVEIAVRDWMRVSRNGGTPGEITVVGDGEVRFFVEGRDEVTVSPTGLGSRSVNLHVGKGSSVRTPNHNASQLMVFAPASFRGTVAGSQSRQAVFDGLVYAPAGPDGDGWVYVKQGEVFGAVVTGDLTLGQYGAVHFDRSIATGSQRAGPSEIDFLHVVLRELLVED